MKGDGRGTHACDESSGAADGRCSAAAPAEAAAPSFGLVWNGGCRTRFTLAAWLSGKLLAVVAHQLGTSAGAKMSARAGRWSARFMPSARSPRPRWLGAAVAPTGNMLTHLQAVAVSAPSSHSAIRKWRSRRSSSNMLIPLICHPLRTRAASIASSAHTCRHDIRYWLARAVTTSGRRPGGGRGDLSDHDGRFSPTQSRCRQPPWDVIRKRGHDDVPTAQAIFASAI